LTTHGRSSWEKFRFLPLAPLGFGHGWHFVGFRVNMKTGSVSRDDCTEGSFDLSTIAARPLRADARRNREKVLTAAAAAFAERGIEAHVEEIAQRAGVGVGTVYRHFPTKEALVSAMADEHFSRLAAALEQALEEDGEPWDVFAATIRRSASEVAADVARCEIMAGPQRGVDVGNGRKRLSTATATLIGRARDSGAMRADATVEDVETILCGFGHVAAARRAGATLDWERYLTIALDGLRAR
jgi:AcrR family transcriptional regulator